MLRLEGIAPVVLSLGLAGVACGDPSPCEENGVSVVIADNHPNGPHTLSVSWADVEAAIAKTYDIQGSNTGHGHTVSLSGEEFESLAAGETVTIISSNNGSVGASHTHTVTLDCRADAD